MRDRVGPELVFGLVGAIGTDLKAVAALLSDALRTVYYESTHINLLDQVLEVDRWAEDLSPFVDERMHQRMNKGNQCREELNRKDALALLAIARIRAERKAVNESLDVEDRLPARERKRRAKGNDKKPIPRRAFILRSLKTPDELDRLRRVYRENCYVVAAYCPDERRRTHLAELISASRHARPEGKSRASAEELIARDQREREHEYGQNVLDTFWQADVFLDATDPSSMQETAHRFVELVFGHPFRTPTRDEYGMFLAHGAALRSSSGGRQVGASIMREGDVVAVGTNEVPTAGGGQYWEGSAPDGRDHMRPFDTTATTTRALFADVLARLRAKKWLVRSKQKLKISDLLEQADDSRVLESMKPEADDPTTLTERAPLLSIIEFMRAVHAEMSTLMSSARHGISVANGVLFSTTFPCHECARHIVAAGIARVVFIEPYPKSRVGQLYDDSISVDTEIQNRVPFRAFVGIAPRLYSTVFCAPERRVGSTWKRWDETRDLSQPRRALPPAAYIDAENESIELLDAAFNAKAISPARGVSRGKLAKGRDRKRTERGSIQARVALQRANEAGAGNLARGQPKSNVRKRTPSKN
jgi:deoxycytidylate deaminase